MKTNFNIIIYYIYDTRLYKDKHFIPSQRRLTRSKIHVSYVSLKFYNERSSNIKNSVFVYIKTQ